MKMKALLFPADHSGLYHVEFPCKPVKGELVLLNIDGSDHEFEIKKITYRGQDPGEDDDDPTELEAWIDVKETGSLVNRHGR